MIRMSGINRKIAAAAAISAAGVLAFSSVNAANAEPQGATKAHNYQVNGKGATFGSAALAKSDAELPDLIAAKSPQGKAGYIKKKDFAPPAPTLEEVLSYPVVIDENGNAVHVAPSRSITLYAVDGVTPVGTMVVGG